MERARTTSFTLGDHYGKFLDDLVASGRYGSTSEVIRESLRLLEQRLEFEYFVRNLPPDDEIVDRRAFETELERRRSESLTPHTLIKGGEMAVLLWQNLGRVEPGTRREAIERLIEIDALDREALEESMRGPTGEEERLLDRALATYRRNPKAVRPLSEVWAELKNR